MTMTDAKAPWDKDNPKTKSGAKPAHLSPAAKASAKKHAAAAGRPYPNLVDNMQAAKASKTKAKAK
jgi:hypothetical protein